LLFGHFYPKGLERRLEELSGCFAVEVADFSVLDNYLHVGMPVGMPGSDFNR
jgi:hypothetical protein